MVVRSVGDSIFSQPISTTIIILIEVHANKVCEVSYAQQNFQSEQGKYEMVGEA